MALYSLRRYDEAVERLCQAVDLDPRDTKALDFLGKMHDISPQYASHVAERLAHFVELYPTNAAANYYYALTLGNRGESYLQKAVQLDPGFHRRPLPAWPWSRKLRAQPARPSPNTKLPSASALATPKPTTTSRASTRNPAKRLSRAKNSQFLKTLR